MSKSDGLDELVAWTRHLAARGAVVPAVTPAVKDASADLQTRMRADYRRSKSFKVVAPTVSREVKKRTAHEIEIEVGPRSGRGSAGNLASIAVTGSSRGGGGTVRDPMEAAQEIVPGLERGLGEALDKLIQGRPRA